MAKVVESSSEGPTPYIIKEENVMGGSARISGSRVRVLDVFMKYKVGSSPEEISEIFEIGLDEVHAALSYYFSNKSEIEEELKNREDLVEETQQRHESKA